MITADADYFAVIRECAESARGVPEADNVNALFATAHAINDAIRAANDFPQIRQSKFRHRAANFGKLRQIFGPRYQFITQPGGRV